jgi:two-component system, response regulator YesN
VNDKLSLQSIMEVSRHYQKATDILCSIMDMSNPLANLLPCTLCEKRSAEQGIDQKQCLELHHHNALQSERFGGSYIYFCSCSLLFWSSPVIIGGIMTHALIAGPVMVLEPAEIVNDLESLGKTFGPGDAARLEAIRRIDISVAHSLSELLRMCAGWASGYREHTMVEARQDLLQQSKLSEYMQELNARMSGQEPEISYYPLIKEQELQEAIRLGDKQTAQELMNELLGIIFFASGNTLDRIRFRVMELVILLSRATVQGGAPEQEIMEISYQCQRELGQQRSTEAIARWLSTILHRYTDLVFDQKRIKHANVILRAVHFMRHNYAGKITLQETAEHVGMSPTYFSRIFNEEMECPFSTYINKIRVEQAKSLLLNTSYTLVEISGLVGFDDQGYFSRVFKTISGTSPGNFRKRAGNFPLDRHEIHTDIE